MLVERKQSTLSGRAQKRADNISNLPYESKIINHLVTTKRLKQYEFLSDAVGSICAYQDFMEVGPSRGRLQKSKKLFPRMKETLVMMRVLMIRARPVTVITYVHLPFMCFS